MLRLRRSYYLMKLLGDLILVAGSFLAASYLDKRRLILPYELNIRELFVLLALLIIWYISAKATSLYDEFRSQHFSFEFFGVIKNALLQAVAVVVHAVFDQDADRSTVFSFCCTVFCWW